MTDAADLSISVALCTRNATRFLEAQLVSICAQTLRPREIVLSDDASSDGSVALARRLIDEGACGHGDMGAGHGGTAPISLRVLENAAPLGVTRNFEQAVRACEGPLIALCDHDDVWHPEKLSRMRARFEQEPQLLLLHTDARMVDADGRPLGASLLETLEVQARELSAIHAGRAFEVFLRRNLVTGATTVFRRTLLEAALPFAQGWVHDEWLGAIAAAASAGCVDVLEDALIDYRQHGANQIGARRLSRAEKLRKAFLPRAERYRRLEQRAETLLARLETLGAAVRLSAVQAQGAKLAHQRFRAGLPAHRLARLPRVLAEALRGNYTRFSRAPHAIVQDLFEPH